MTRETRDLVQTLTELRQDGKIIESGWAAVEPAVAELTAGVPESDD